MINKGIILAGGLGSRLGKIVKNTPKPFLLVNGRPFIQKIVERLINQGINHIIFCLSYKAQKIRNLIKQSFVNAFKEVSSIMMPTCANVSFKLNSIQILFSNSTFLKYFIQLDCETCLSFHSKTK